MITCTKLLPAHHEAVTAIANALPEWFDEDARTRAIPIDIRHQKGYVAVLDGSVVGFITFYVVEGCLTIGWLGVRKEHQRRGIGQALLRVAETHAVNLGISHVTVYTLGDNVDYPPYEQTRAFYFKNGFLVYKRCQTDNESCPEEIWLKKEAMP